MPGSVERSLSSAFAIDFLVLALALDTSPSECSPRLHPLFPNAQIVPPQVLCGMLRCVAVALGLSGLHIQQVYEVVPATRAVAAPNSPAILPDTVPFLDDTARETMVSAFARPLRPFI